MNQDLCFGGVARISDSRDENVNLAKGKDLSDLVQRRGSYRSGRTHVNATLSVGRLLPSILSQYASSIGSGSYAPRDLKGTTSMTLRASTRWGTHADAIAEELSPRL